MRENHEKAYRSPDFLRRSTGREQLCATFFTESRMEFRGSTNLYRKSGFGLHQLRNCSLKAGNPRPERTPRRSLASTPGFFRSPMIKKATARVGCLVRV